MRGGVRGSLLKLYGLGRIAWPDLTSPEPAGRSWLWCGEDRITDRDGRPDCLDEQVLAEEDFALPILLGVAEKLARSEGAQCRDGLCSGRRSTALIIISGTASPVCWISGMDAPNLEYLVNQALNRSDQQRCDDRHLYWRVGRGQVLAKVDRARSLVERRHLAARAWLHRGEACGWVGGSTSNLPIDSQ